MKTKHKLSELFASAIFAGMAMVYVLLNAG